MAKRTSVFKDAFNRSLALLKAGEAVPSEPELARALGVSRTTVRAVLRHLGERGLVGEGAEGRRVLRRPLLEDRFPAAETDSVSDIIERHFMRRILADGAIAGTLINELELARAIGVGTTAVREFLIRFSRFGLIEKRPNSQWVLKGFTREFALELTEVRELFELRAALAFAALPAQAAAWRDLDEVEADHLALRASIDQGFLAFSELDERFHRLVHAASGNRFVMGFYDVIALVFHYHYQWHKAGARERNAQAIEEHLQYIAALKTRDPQQVEVACRRHLASARRTLFDSVALVGTRIGSPADR